jgi:hypothetical protein
MQDIFRLTNHFVGDAGLIVNTFLQHDCGPTRGEVDLRGR